MVLFLGIAAVGLAVVGVYGVAAFATGRRTKEFGIGFNETYGRGGGDRKLTHHPKVLYSGVATALTETTTTNHYECAGRSRASKDRGSGFRLIQNAAKADEIRAANWRCAAGLRKEEWKNPVGAAERTYLLKNGAKALISYWKDC